jgi:pyruvate dehydrogenase E2 component (dihydrolipoamide acetyltransferase)
MHAVVMPKLGLTMTEGAIAGWLKQPGDAVTAGEEIAEIETDKITYTLEAPADGTLLEILLPAGETAPVKETIAWIGEPYEALPDANAEARPPSAEEPVSANQPNNQVNHDMSASVPVNQAAANTILATPFAKKVARENSVSLGQVSGSGPNGRIQSADVEEFLHCLIEHPKATPAAEITAKQAGVDISHLSQGGERVRRADVEAYVEQYGAQSVEQTNQTRGRLIPHSSMRKAIANRMTESWTTIPHVTLHRTTLVTGMLDLQKRASDLESKKISLTAVIASLVSRVLPKFPYLNAHYEKEGCRVYDDVHLGIAVSVQNGLIVPVIRDANTKSIPELANEIAVLSERARAGSLTANDIEEGTFTISSLGMYGIDGFTPIILPPQTGILGIGRTVTNIGQVGDAASAQSSTSATRATSMTISLSFDHRAVDGVYGAEFLVSLAKCFADPLRILL